MGATLTPRAIVRPEETWKTEGLFCGLTEQSKKLKMGGPVWWGVPFPPKCVTLGPKGLCPRETGSQEKTTPYGHLQPRLAWSVLSQEQQALNLNLNFLVMLQKQTKKFTREKFHRLKLHHY